MRKKPYLNRPNMLICVDLDNGRRLWFRNDEIKIIPENNNPTTGIMLSADIDTVYNYAKMNIADPDRMGFNFTSDSFDSMWQFESFLRKALSEMKISVSRIRITKSKKCKKNWSRDDILKEIKAHSKNNGGR